MALRKKLKVEDAIIGTFVVLALLYPLITTWLIYTQRKEESSKEIDVLRTAYIFIAGLEDCSPETAARIAERMDGKLLRRLGGVGGLVKLCMKNRERITGSVSVEENIERSGRSVFIDVLIKVRDRGTVKERFKIEVFGYRGEGGLRITEVRYAEGS
ncbi:hypothetical protein [Hydrogenivirga sp.]